MTTKICRICLRTDEKLRELEERLADYFGDMCDFASGISTYMCCSVCEDSLRHNLDFRNKCRKSNQILQEWLKSKNKTSIHLLHQLVQTSPNNIDIKQESESDHELSGDDTKQQSNDDKDEVITELDKVKEISNKDEEIKIEIKSEVVTDENEAIILEDKVISDPYPYYVAFHEENVAKDTIDDSDWSSDEVVNEPVKTKLEIQKDIINDNVEVVDIESASSKNREAKRRTRKIKHKNQDQQDSSNYEKFGTVLDIKFESEQEARSEVAQRRVSEPYVSARHRCEVCHTVYKSDGLLRYHLKWHDLQPAEFECSVCRMRFPPSKAMVHHEQCSNRGQFTYKVFPLATHINDMEEAKSSDDEKKILEEHADAVTSSVAGPPLIQAPKKCKTRAERQREYRLRQKLKMINNIEERKKTSKRKIEYQRQYRLEKRMKKAQNFNGEKPAKKTRADYQREYRIRKKLKEALASSAEMVPGQEAGPSWYLPPATTQPLPDRGPVELIISPL